MGTEAPTALAGCFTWFDLYCEARHKPYTSSHTSRTSEHNPWCHSSNPNDGTGCGDDSSHEPCSRGRDVQSHERTSGCVRQRMRR